MGKHFTSAERMQIETLNKQGYTHRAIGEQLGYSRMQIKEYFHRLYRKNRAVQKLELPKRRGRKPAVTLQEYKCENKRLKMENDLLRSFLQVAGRR